VTVASGRYGGFVPTKRALAESYLLGTGATLAAVAGGVALRASTDAAAVLGLAAGLLPGCGLAAVTLWLRRAEFDRGQVWRVATWGALGTGLVAVCLVGALVARALTVSPTLTVGLTALTAGCTLGGTLLGAAVESRRSADRLAVRNSVLHRVLRHNLRNDLSVVLTHVEAVEADLEGRQAEQLETAARKVEALVDLVDRVRRVDTAPAAGQQPEPVDLVSVVQRRVADLRNTHPDVTVETDTPESAWTLAEQQFGLVVDNVVESAVVHGDGAPSLAVTVTASDGTVTLRVEDRDGALPAADLAALADGGERRLTHGHGVELWLVAWLAERSDGTVSVDRRGGTVVSVTLPRVHPPKRRGHPLPAPVARGE